MKLSAVAGLFVGLAPLWSGEAQLFLSQACDSLIARTFDDLQTDNCVCEPNIRSLSVFLECKASEKICVVPGSNGGLCGFPHVTLDFSLRDLLRGRLPFVTTICYANATIAENPIPSAIPFCINSEEGPLALLSGRDIASDAVANETNETAASTSTSITEGEPCTARFGGQDCASCTLCDPDTGGIIFNCSNISPLFMSTTCTRLPTGF